jgi:hypothetical protein
MKSGRVYGWYAAFICLAAPAAFGGGAATNPGSVVKEFYTWYMACSRKVPGPCERIAEKKELVTPSLYNQIRKASGLDPRTAENYLDFDPFIDAQVHARSFAAGEEKVSGDTASVPVTITYERGGEKKIITVALQRTGSVWRISNFLGGEGYDLAKTLAEMNGGK